MVQLVGVEPEIEGEDGWYLDAASHVAVERSPRLWLVEIATGLVRSALAVPLGVSICVGCAMMFGTGARTGARRVDMVEDPLTTLAFGCFALATTMYCLPLFSLRRVTARDDGQMKTLRAGTVLISAAAAKWLRRWHVSLLVISALTVLAGLHIIVNCTLLGNEDQMNPVLRSLPNETQLEVWQRVGAVPIGLFWAYLLPLSVWAWWLSLKEASVLVSDKVTECRNLIDKTSATSAEWDARVVPELLTLINDTLPALSSGWADGLLAVWASMWVLALGFGAMFLDNVNGYGDTVFLPLTVAFACIPLGLAADAAGASSDCNAIRTSLNDKRKQSAPRVSQCKPVRGQIPC